MNEVVKLEEPRPATRGGEEAGWIAACVAGGLAIRLWLMSSNTGLTMDSPTYVVMAESLGRGERSIGYQHHGYPALVALASLFIPGRELPGRTVSLLAGLALIGVVYALARLRLPPRWAAVAAGLVVVNPLLAGYAGPIMSESTFALLVTAGLLLVELARPLAAGATLGFACVVRPEGAAVALLAGPLARLRGRAFVLLLVGLAVAVLPYAGYLRWDLGVWTLTTKAFPVHALTERGLSREYRVGATEHPQAEPDRSFAERVLQATASAASRAPRQLLRYVGRVMDAWPVPLLLLSAVGLSAAPGTLLAPLLLVVALSLLPLPQELRFVTVAVPALAVQAAIGARRLAFARPGWRRASLVVVVLILAGGASWAWTGRAGAHALHFDDGPMAEYRAAGEWLGAHGRAGATVMDRKAYVPFFARMKHVQLGDDDYDTIVEHARRTGVDYLVVEEFVVMTLRPQFTPLLADRRFRENETRLRPIHIVRGAVGTGVAIFEVVRDIPPRSGAGPAPGGNPDTEVEPSSGGGLRR